MAVKTQLAPSDAELFLVSAFSSQKGKKRERRVGERYATNASARVWVLWKNRRKTLTAKVVEVSKSGLRLCVLEYLPAGTKVRVIMQTVTADGEIRWCQSGVENFRVGLEIAGLAPTGSDHLKFQTGAA
jgi:hypothetical protein